MSSIGATAKAGASDALKRAMSHWAFWAVVAILLLFVAYRSQKKISTWWRNLRRRNTADTRGHQMNAEDTARVKIIAKQLLAEIHRNTVPIFNPENEGPYMAALALNATEFIALCDEYQHINDGTSLLEDLDNEWGLSNLQEQLRTRCNEVGAPKMLRIPIIDHGPDPDTVADAELDHAVNLETQ